MRGFTDPRVVPLFSSLIAFPRLTPGSDTSRSAGSDARSHSAAAGLSGYPSLKLERAIRSLTEKDIGLPRRGNLCAAITVRAAQRVRAIFASLLMLDSRLGTSSRAPHRYVVPLSGPRHEPRYITRPFASTTFAGLMSRIVSITRSRDRISSRADSRSSFTVAAQVAP